MNNVDPKTKLVNELYAVQFSLRDIQKNMSDMSDCTESQKQDINNLILDLKSLILKLVFEEGNT